VPKLKPLGTFSHTRSVVSFRIIHSIATFPLLNSERLGAYHELARAKPRIDWEIWNRVWQMMPG
jgi:hypothetical protein